MDKYEIMWKKLRNNVCNLNYYHGGAADAIDEVQDLIRTLEKEYESKEILKIKTKYKEVHMDDGANYVPIHEDVTIVDRKGVYTKYKLLNVKQDPNDKLTTIMKLGKMGD
jgi:hypothetical protein